jgi:RNA-binding protein Tab2/Atab2
MSKIWELDFYSRPIVDENNKKLWEVLICESPVNATSIADDTFKYSQYCPSTTVNSIWLGSAIAAAIEKAGETPKKIRFFRRQMNNMIVKACEELGIAAAPSRRTYYLDRWLDERMTEFYPQEAGYDTTAAISTSVKYPDTIPVPLPEAVRGDKGDKWAFVSLEASAFAEMGDWDIAFGESFPLSIVETKTDVKIPGLIVFSPRAVALAGWMSGLEMSCLQLEVGSRAIVRLETGANDSWILVNLTDEATLSEAKGFEEAKNRAGGVHFLALQTNPDSESFAGFWLLKSN